VIRAGIGLALVCSTLLAGSVLTPVEREVYVMGTRARLVTYAAGRDAGLSTLNAALTSLEATEAELSTWRAESAISQLNRSPVGTPWTASSSLCAMFDEVYRWRDATHSAFDPAIGALTAAWGIHGTARIPSPDELANALTRSGLSQLVFDRAACTLTRITDVTLDVGAFGKGEGLDRAVAVLGHRSGMIDLGGQISVSGLRPDDRPWTVGIADPRNRERPVVEVHMRRGSLATSSGSERDQTVKNQRVGHILDPRTGRPAPFAGSVTVWHERGLVADMLSTALYVMGPQTGLAWAEARGLSALFLIPEGSTVHVRTTTAFGRTLPTQKVD
jgi:thiamine biosynthesis lipoprotein